MSFNFWRVAPGENAEFWVDSASGNFIALELGFFLVRLSKKEREEALNVVNQNDFVEKYKNNFRDKEQEAIQLWYFLHEIKEGDIVIANKGKERVIGAGIVESDVYIKEHEYFPIRREVFWILKDINIPVPKELKSKFEKIVEKLTANDIEKLHIREHTENYLKRINEFLNKLP